MTTSNDDLLSAIDQALDDRSLTWAAQWIEDSLKGETNERVIEFGKNMAMTLRAVKADTRARVRDGEVATGDVNTCANCGGTGDIEIGCAMDHALTAPCVECNGTGHISPAATAPITALVEEERETERNTK